MKAPVELFSLWSAAFRREVAYFQGRKEKAASSSLPTAETTAAWGGTKRRAEAEQLRAAIEHFIAGVKAA